MKLREIFDEAILHADQVVKLHSAITTKNKRAIRSDWSDRFYGAKLVGWPQKAGLWRSHGANLLIVGTDKAELSHEDFSADALLTLLRSGLVLTMAAVDKLLHEAVSKQFVSLVKQRKLDDLLKLELSASYSIAMDARVRKGKGGKIKSRPGTRFKAAILEKLYRESFLAPDKLQRIAKACGCPAAFHSFGRSVVPPISEEEMRRQWGRLYARRNSIAHECDIVRTAKTKRVRFHAVTATELRQDIVAARAFGAHLADQLDK